jgi:hypothetical protein
MNLFKRKPDGFYRGLGAEFAFRSKDGVVVISGGEVIRIALESGPEGTNSARIVLDRDDLEKVVIEEGDIREVAARFEAISRKALEPRSMVAVPRKGVYAALAAFTAISLVLGWHGAQIGEVDPVDTIVSQDVGKMLGGIVPPTNVPFAGGQLAGPPGSLPSDLSGIPPKVEQKASPIFDKPSFLSLNDETAPKTAAAPKKAATPEETAKAEPLVPAYSEGMYDKPSTKTVSAPPVAESKLARQTDQSDVAAKTTTLPSIAAAPTSGQTDEEVLQSLEQTPTVVPVAEAERAKPAAAAPRDEKAAVQPGAKDPQKDAAKDLDPTSKLTAGLVSSGMTQAKAVEVAAQLEQLSKLGGEEGITPEMLAQLPHDVAQLLKENGLLANMEKPVGEAGVPYAIIRLPEAVIDRYRGKDGIPAIPVNDSYAALGNKVSIPLPGGGDVKDPQDLQAFGFKP